MVTGTRFEEIIHEVNGLESPELVRIRELSKVLNAQLYDEIRSCFNKINEQSLKPESIIMSKKLWDLISSDPEFTETKK